MNARLARTGYPTLLATTTALAVMASLLIAPAADAASSFSYRVSGQSAATHWTQLDGIATGVSPVGNTHIGYLNADETTKGKAAVFGYIEDWDCEPGETPGWGGHVVDDGPTDEPEPEPNQCDWMGSRYIDSYDVPFTFDKKLNSARLTGTLTVYGGGHDGGVVGRPAADIIWTGVGDVSSGSYTSRWREGNTWYSESYRSSNRNATMSGTMGPMGFDPELSGGWLSTYRASSRSRTR